MTTQPTTPDLEPRITELEIKASYAEDLLDTLNQTVFEQQQQIDRLLREVLQLREQLASASAGAAPRDDRPPHY